MSMSRVLFSALVTSTFLALPGIRRTAPLDAGSYADRAPAPIRLAAGAQHGRGFFDFCSRRRCWLAHAPAYRGGEPMRHGR